MNLTEARIILQCRRTKESGEIWLKLKLYGMQYSRNYIYSISSNLAKLGYLIKREINDGGKTGRSVFYTATPQAIVEAMNFLEAYMKSMRKSSGVVIANIKSLNEFIAT